MMLCLPTGQRFDSPISVRNRSVYLVNNFDSLADTTIFLRNCASSSLRIFLSSSGCFKMTLIPTITNSLFAVVTRGEKFYSRPLILINAPSYLPKISISASYADLTISLYGLNLKSPGRFAFEISETPASVSMRHRDLMSSITPYVKKGFK
ncbi:hypothetical protein NGRA_2147 [Nosema granulosis]|uniref:Uncharacterized protein n=1 Tax=Nosema granulosis TaxID=83296 RepID=A0A9P6KYF8_9MICR|nr:hypothetical protein NGRA_2147 [Nosema granulosis]